MKKKLSLLVLFAVGIGLFYYFDLGQYLTLEGLKENKERLDLFYRENTVLTIFGFIGVYIAVVALSLPGATLLTLTGGAIFGSVMGTLIVNVGATLGATLAFLVARFLLRDWVERKYGDKLKPFNEGFSKNALNYLLFLRLVPLFPFFLINLVSGLTRLRLPVYFFGTMFGILPGSFVYANAGSQLASIDSLSDIASPGVLGAFALLGLFALIPTLYKRIKDKNTAPSAVKL
ncbi:MAG: TVP38/TMEM64 family protein [Nitrospinaceae bacterium]